MYTISGQEAVVYKLGAPAGGNDVGPSDAPRCHADGRRPGFGPCTPVRRQGSPGQHVC